MEIPTEGLVLDLGCGYGVVGVFLGKFNPNLTIHLIDVNLRAIELAKKNLELNNVKNYQVFTGDLQTILKQNNCLYDAIYFNPPIRIGKKNYISIIIDVLEYLKKEGMFFIVIKHNLGAESAYQEIIYELEQRDIDKLYETMIIAKNSGYWVIKILRK